MLDPSVQLAVVEKKILKVLLKKSNDCLEILGKTNYLEIPGKIEKSDNRIFSNTFRESGIKAPPPTAVGNAKLLWCFRFECKILCTGCISHL